MRLPSQLLLPVSLAVFFAACDSTTVPPRSAAREGGLVVFLDEKGKPYVPPREDRAAMRPHSTFTSSEDAAEPFGELAAPGGGTMVILTDRAARP